MIHFFRRIRQRLLSDGKASKYLLYAIGEIALVMIGILLALQINNWNEARKARLAESQALYNLKKEFEANHVRLQTLTDFRKGQERSFRDYIDIITDDNISIAAKMKADRPNLFHGKWGNVNTVLTGLVNSGGIENIQNDSLKQLLTQWPVYIDRFLTYETNFVQSIHSWKEYVFKFRPHRYVVEGNYVGDWPGNEHHPNVAVKLDEFSSSKIESIEHYNILGNITDQIYIYLITSIELTEKYELITELIDEELSLRHQ